MSSQNPFFVGSPPPTISSKLANSTAGSPAQSISSVRRKPVPRIDLEELLQDSNCAVSTSPSNTSHDIFSGQSSLSEVTQPSMGSSLSKTRLRDSVSTSDKHDLAESISPDANDKTPMKMNAVSTASPWSRLSDSPSSVVREL